MSSLNEEVETEKKVSPVKRIRSSFTMREDLFEAVKEYSKDENISVSIALERALKKLLNNQ